MKLNVELDSGLFEKAISDGIKALSQEELGNIIKQVVYEAFTKCPEFKDLLIKRQSPRWGGNDELVLGSLAEAAVKSIDMETALAPFKEKMVNALIENHREIVESMILRCMIEKITYDDHFKRALEDSVRMILTREANRG